MPAAIAAGDFAVVTANARRTVENVARARKAAVMAKIVTFGEIMLRLSPPGFERLFQSPSLSATFGGGEANVAVSLAHFGQESWYVTRLPKHAIGEAAVKALRAEGVRTDAIVRGGDRVGIYFAETGASQRASTRDLRPRAFGDERDDGRRGRLGRRDDRRRVVARHRASRPALGAKAAAATRAAIDAARAAGARVSIDLNYRKKLWSETEAQATMRPLVDGRGCRSSPTRKTCRACLACASPTRTSRQAAWISTRYRAAAESVARDFSVGLVAITLRESLSASDNGWSAVLWDQAAGAWHVGPRYDVRLVDRIGGGDSFAAGLIFGLVTGRTPPAGAALCGGGQRAQADDSRRLQPRGRGRSGPARRGRCVRPRAAIGR